MAMEPPYLSYSLIILNENRIIQELALVLNIVSILGGILSAIPLLGGIVGWLIGGIRLIG